MRTNLVTERLILQDLEVGEAVFIMELLNSPGWLRFIGDRNIRGTDDAEAYIQRILDNPLIRYWIVKMKDTGISIGIITYIKRDYFEYHDLGFAFLPAYSGLGYAFESAGAVLEELVRSRPETTLLATTALDNVDSMRLLEKLGFVFKDKIEVENKQLNLFKMNVTEGFP